MKIKRFVDSDMRQVLRRVREDQGPDAVILSNRRVPEGIEVIAAVDYDEALMQHALGSAPRESSRPAPSMVREGGTESAEPARAVAGDAAAPAPESAGVPEATPSGREEAIRIVAAELESRSVEEETPAGRLPEASTLAGTFDSEALRSLQCEVSSMRGILETQLSELLWKESMRKSPTLAQILRNLTKLGVGPDVADLIANRLAPVKDPKELWRAPLLELARTLPLAEDDLLLRGGIAALVGPTGVGKTTTIAKMAFRYAIENSASDIALISADAHRIGAQEHLATFAKLLGVTVYPAEDVAALGQLLDQLGDKKLILIDTEGTSQRDVDIAARLAAYGGNRNRVRFYLTLGANCQEAGLDETVRVFKRLPLAGAVITKIDEAAQLGCVLGALIRHELPAAYVSDGQRIPDDLYPAARKRLWLINQAVEGARSSQIRISEDMMIEKFANLGAANA